VVQALLYLLTHKQHAQQTQLIPAPPRAGQVSCPEGKQGTEG